ncbi:hypothetical protein GIB67_023000 [Kingdonia uniflora]|uniref:Rhamnogalacturonan endolyase n=1 Tax=Kingdonia uniflora TaxID=39325 RepID=A0A7J7P2I2_9MAGN|nr:hypothetical protein GIB67_023000 [Kingdonia uniflora]
MPLMCVLAPPGQAGSWQTQGKDYQFWVKTNEEGYFIISNVREGYYNLNAWVPGFIGDFKRDGDITITAGCDINLGDLVFRPPRNGPTLWEIGIPDRSAKEFYIPDPNPRYINKLFVSQTSNSEPSRSSNRFRQYGLWERYTELYPYQDLIYRIGVSDYRNDWFFAHVTRNAGNSFQPSTWQVAFPLANVNYLGTYTLRLAFASATNADLDVGVNNPQADGRRFKVGLTGRDNAIARHGIHGLYWLFHFEIPGYLLVRGTNTIYITQSRCTSPFTGIMYDYLRLEGPSGYHYEKSGYQFTTSTLTVTTLFSIWTQNLRISQSDHLWSCGAQQLDFEDQFVPVMDPIVELDNNNDINIDLDGDDMEMEGIDGPLSEVEAGDESVGTLARKPGDLNVDDIVESAIEELGEKLSLLDVGKNTHGVASDDVDESS